MSIKIPIGTRMYLRKRRPFKLYIQPDKNILNDSLYVAYDVRIDGITVIPRGTRVLGSWITESCPCIAAQFQVDRIYLKGSGQITTADSDLFEGITEYNANEICNAPYLYKIMDYYSPANILRRIVKASCQVQVLYDRHLNTPYIEITTKEIPVTFTSDFIINYC